MSDKDGFPPTFHQAPDHRERAAGLKAILLEEILGLWKAHGVAPDGFLVLTQVDAVELVEQICRWIVDR